MFNVNSSTKAEIRAALIKAIDDWYRDRFLTTMMRVYLFKRGDAPDEETDVDFY